MTNGFLVEAKNLIEYKSNNLEEKEAINIELNEQISDSKNVIDLDCNMWKKKKLHLLTSLRAYKSKLMRKFIPNK